MPAFPVTALAVAAALAAGPTTALTPAPAPVAPVASSVCTQGTSSSGGSTGQLTPQQAAQLLQQVRELVTELTGVVGDSRAANLGQGLRSMGITPARAPQMWKQQAYDLADGLKTAAATDPRAMQVAVTLAGAGFSPTPADLLSAVTEATPAAAPGAITSPAAAPAAASPNVVAAATSGALAAAIDRVRQDTATPSDAGAGTAPDGSGTPGDAGPAPSSSAASSTSPHASSGAQVCGASPGSPGTGPQAQHGTASAAGRRGSTGNGTPVPPSEGTSRAATQASGIPSGDAADWQRHASDLMGKLQAAGDPEATQLAGKLAGLGIASSAPAGWPGAPANTDQTGSSDSNTVNHEQQVDTNTGAHTAPSSLGSTPSHQPTSNSSGAASTAPPSGSPPTGQQPGSQQVGWEQRARELADKLAAAGDDPTARELADKLTAAGITAAPARSNQNNQPAGPQPSDNASDAAGTGTPEPPAPAAAAAQPAPQPDPGVAGAAAGADIGTWDKLAQCESGQRWDTSTGNGHHGGLQFDAATWRAYGGDQYAPTADKATKDQQIAVAEKVRDARGGYGSWPACAKRLGLR